MVSGRSEPRERSGRLGGARADFVASLGRKVAGCREALCALEDDPASKASRDELRRRLHALCTGARLLRFDAMARTLQEAGAVLERAGASGVLTDADHAFIVQVLDDLPALAWGEAPPREGDSRPSPHPLGTEPAAVLVVGGDGIVQALVDEAQGAAALECERTDDPQDAIGLARRLAPDVVVVDADVDAAEELVSALLDDPRTEPMPIVVVGSFPPPERSAPFAALGVAKTLQKPVPADVLRQAVEEALEQRRPATTRATLVEPTLEHLADRLAQEVRRALVQSVDRPALRCRVPLGEGTDVLGPLWGAIARIREVVTEKTDGAVRFGADGPEGAIALAPWLSQAGGDRWGAGARLGGAAADVELAGRRVLVVDDDPDVARFVGGLLRAAGCEVEEASDGRAGLESAFRWFPELVVSDVLMPGLDGFAFCRALKRDVALRDTPVLLLSWKEDLLQHVRQVGGGGILGGDVTSAVAREGRMLLARVREALRPRARLEARVRGPDEVRGRLDGVTVRSLLDLVARYRSSARISLRDAAFLYEIEVRDGAPRRATRTAADGVYQSGERVLAAALGVRAGRFVVAPSDDPVRGGFEGGLAAQLARPLAIARAALAVTTGARAMNVEQVMLDDAALAHYLSVTPAPARGVVERLAAGASPRQMLLAGDTDAGALEEVLVDLSSRGAILEVRGPNGADLLGPAVDEALALLEQPRPAAPPQGGVVIGRVQLKKVPASPRPSPPPSPVPARRSSPRPPAPPVPSFPVPSSPVPSSPPPSPRVVRERSDDEFETLTLSDPPPEKAPPSFEEPGAPSSLEDAMLREISERSAGNRAARPSSPQPLVEPSQLRPRPSSNPPLTLEEIAADEMPSLPPDAVVPDAGEDEAPHAPEPTPKLGTAPWTEPLGPTRTSSAPPPKAKAEAKVEDEEPPTPLTPPTAPTAPIPLVNVRSNPPPPPRERPSWRSPLPTQFESVSPQETEAAPAKRRSRWGLFVAFGLVAVVVGFGLRYASAPYVGGTARHRPDPTPPLSATPPAPTVAPTVPRGPVVHLRELPPGAEVGQGQGLLEVTAPVEAPIRIEGEVRGRGPRFALPLPPGFYNVRVGTTGREQTSLVEVRTGRSTHVDFTKGP